MYFSSTGQFTADVLYCTQVRLQCFETVLKFFSFLRLKIEVFMNEKS